MPQKRLLFGAVLVAVAAASVYADTTDAPSGSVIGRTVANFTLSDFRSKTCSLSDWQESKLIVVAFIGTECPLVQLYAQRLQQLADSYPTEQVVVVGIDSNQQDSLAEMEHFARTHNLRFPLLKDPGNRVADLFGAQRTPEVFVLDAQRVIRYRGRIDDQYTYETQRVRHDQEYLREAVAELLANKPVSTAETEVVGCHIGRVFVDTKDDGVTYNNQISRILGNRCVECHRAGEIAPFALESYDEVVGWAEMIQEVVRDQRMPPWHASPDHGSFANDRRLSQEEKGLIDKWVEDGAPEGDPNSLPPPGTYVSGWQLPREPDLLIRMRQQPYDVPPEGQVDYQYFVVDPGLTEDKWVSAAQCLPGNRRVVHHILVFAQPPGSKAISGEEGGFLAAYVPGLIAQPYPPGMAKRLRAGSKLIFQVHYTPVGTSQQDVSSLGLLFADHNDLHHEVRTVAAVKKKLEIPPGEPSHRVEATSRSAPIDVLLLTMMPHMHLRGKSFLYETRFPDGTTETLLDVPNYDFNWQTAYRLTQPKFLPAGTTVHCVAHFDNSDQNLANPDPTATVKWGDQTTDEMMIGYFDIAVPLNNPR